MAAIYLNQCRSKPLGTAGVWRLFDLFDEIKWPASIPVNTSIYAYCPEVMAAARAHRYDIVAHGRTNSERQGPLDEAAEKQLISPNFAQNLRKCLKRLNTRKICSHNGRNKSLDVASSEDSNRSTWALGRFFSCATTSRTSPKAQCSHCSLAKASNSKHLCSAKAKFGLVRVCLRRSNTLNHLDHLVGTG